MAPIIEREPSRPAIEEGGTAITPRRVLLIDIPHLLSDIVVRALGDVPGGVRIESMPSREGAASASPDPVAMVILPARHPVGPELAEVLASHPGASVLLLEGDAERGSLAELWPRQRDLGELSPERLRSALAATTPWANRFAAGAGIERAGGEAPGDPEEPDAPRPTTSSHESKEVP